MATSFGKKLFTFYTIQRRLYRQRIPIPGVGSNHLTTIASVAEGCRRSFARAPSLEEGTKFPPSMLEILRVQVESGNLHYDMAQERVAKRLSRLQKALIDYDNEILFRPIVVKKEEHITTESNHNHSLPDHAKTAMTDNSETTPSLRIPRGLYIYGCVGTGKTMLMDTFYAHAPVQKKARYHFHNFLAQVHQQIYELKQQDLKEKGRNFSVDTLVENNPIHRVGLQFSRSTSLLCLDEFQVTDIADAVILSQLFSVLFLKGTVVVATSNRPPQDLYEGGLNRSYFLPFLDLLEQHCIVHAIQSDLDYRRTLASCSSFFTDKDAIGLVLEDVIETVVGADITNPLALDLTVGFQRIFRIDRMYESSSDIPVRLCRLDFVQVCDADVGALDYRAISNTFDIVCLENVQAMDLEGHNRARRFITLIDELYEAKCCLLLGTEQATPMDLFRVATHPPSNDLGVPENALGVDVATQGGMAVGALASVRELAFAFERASSRIVEMCSRSWWEKQLAGKVKV